MFITLTSGRVTVGGTHITSVAQLHELIESEAAARGLAPEDFPVHKSSSIDFADEYTDDPVALAICRAISRPITRRR